MGKIHCSEVLVSGFKQREFLTAELTKPLLFVWVCYCVCQIETETHISQ